MPDYDDLVIDFAALMAEERRKLRTNQKATLKEKKKSINAKQDESLKKN